MKIWFRFILFHERREFGHKKAQEEHLNHPTWVLLLEALEYQLQHLNLNQTTGFLHLEGLIDQLLMIKVLMEGRLQKVQKEDLQDHRQLMADLEGNLHKLGHLTGDKNSNFSL